MQFGVGKCPNYFTFGKMKLVCPLPKLDFDIITLGHGSGGLLTQRLLEKLVFEGLGDALLPQQHDAALLTIESNVVMTTDSFVVSPLQFPGGTIGDLAINGTINDLAMAGANPKHLSLGLILEEGLAVQTLWDILISIREACLRANVKIVTGDTKVVERGKGDGVFINTTGIGERLTTDTYEGSRLSSGDVVLISGPIASHGMAIMSVRENLSFESAIESDTCSVYPQVSVLLNELESDVKFLRDPTRGGLGTVLVELAETHRLGIELQQQNLPVLPTVKAACELLGLDPIYVANEGIFICIVSPEKEKDSLALLNKGLENSSAAKIGSIVEDHPGKVTISSGFGGKRIVNRLVGHQLPRIC